MKAVIPAAGLGTRFLPAAKAMPKEMLPVVDKPVIQYVVEEAVESGIDDILIITGRGKRAIEDHFDYSFELEHQLRASGKKKMLEEVKSIADLADIHFIRQKEPKGLGHAILCAEKHIGDEMFAVLLGDDIVECRKPCTQQLLDIYKRYKGSIIGVEEVPEEAQQSYGIVEGEQVAKGVFRISRLIEKPARGETGSNLAVFGRYVLTPEIFKVLRATPPGFNGEIQLTDALNDLCRRQPMFAALVDGKVWDVGNKLNWIKANIELALLRDEFKAELGEYLKALTVDR